MADFKIGSNQTPPLYGQTTIREISNEVVRNRLGTASPAHQERFVPSQSEQPLGLMNPGQLRALVSGKDVLEAQATTDRRDASLARLAQGPVQTAQGVVSQQDGYKGISDASWDRFNQSYQKLPEAARSSVNDQYTVVASDWSKQPGNSERFQRMSPGQHQELSWTWQAQAAGNYGNSKGAQGSQADLVNLRDGARQ